MSIQIQYLWVLLVLVLGCKNIKEEDTRQRYGVQDFGNSANANFGVDSSDGDGLDAGGNDSDSNGTVDSTGSADGSGSVDGGSGDNDGSGGGLSSDCLLYTSPSPRDKRQSRMPSSA